ncbi:MAG: autotransporter outer membrane beta-barrel domain-containing protein, partial [Gammaproteobacteria bacterium]|nr:autotransporter outer membrane beta-barrel domain-containing protein [Gammaproteobacteria bacterium]
SRFGRGVAEQVIGAVEARLSAPPEETVLRVRVGGVDLESFRSGDAPDADPSGEGSPVAGEGLAAGANPAAGAADAEDRPAASGPEALDEIARRPAAREAAPSGLPEIDWLGGTAFTYARGDANGSLKSLWGRGAVSEFAGRDGEARVDGRVESWMLGADWLRGGQALGLLLAHSRGDGDYREAESGGRLEAELTGLYPYARHDWDEGLSLWGVAGYGEGDVELARAQETLKADLRMWMAAAGLRGRLCPAMGAWPELSAVADGLWLETRADGAAGLPGAVDAEVSRLRVGLEGAWAALPLGAGRLLPRIRLNLRHDGGDAEHGFGTEVQAGAQWTDARHGLSAQLQGHALLTHEQAGTQAHGVSGSLAWDPDPGSLRGPAFSLGARLGAEPAGEGLLAGEGFGEGLGAGARATQWQAVLGYGAGALGDRATAVPQLRLGRSEDAWDLGLGWRLLAEQFELALEAARLDPAGGRAEDRIEIQLQGRW